MERDNNKNGFTLLETLVAISILVTAIMGPLALAAQTIRAQQVAKDNLIAANLAQEGIELIRNYRSNNVLRLRKELLEGGNGTLADRWMEGMDRCFDAGCGIDADVLIDMPFLPACLALNACALGFDASLNLYTHCNAGADFNCEQTPFNRVVRIQDIGAVSDQEVLVRVTVSWSGILGQKSLEATTHLLNWDDLITQ